MSVGAMGPSFRGNSVTKNGADYDKTKTGKGIGIGLGSAIGCRVGFKTLNSINGFTKGSLKALAVGNLIAWGLTGLGVGAIFDHFTNKKRANKADVEQGKVMLKA